MHRCRTSTSICLAAKRKDRFCKCIERLSLKTTNHRHSRLMRLYIGFAIESVLILFKEMPSVGARLPFLNSYKLERSA